MGESTRVKFDGDVLAPGLSGELMGVHDVMLYNTCTHM